MAITLVTPQGSDFLKNWVAQNAVNCDRIDDAAGPFAIQSYAPVLTSSGTNPLLGTGFITGNYYTLFDQVFTWGEFRFGTGFNQGSGTFEVSLPFNALTIAPPDTGSGGGPIIGNSRVWVDASGATRQPGSVQLRTANKIMFSVRAESGAGGRAMGSGIPVTWAINDGINWFARYTKVDT